MDQALLDRVAWAIEETLPARPDPKNQSLYQYARALKSFLLPSTPDALLMGLFSSWFRSVPGTIGTSGFLDTLDDFIRVWNIQGEHFRHDYFELTYRETSQSRWAFPEVRRPDQQTAKFLFHSGLIYAGRPGLDGNFFMDYRRIAAVIGKSLSNAYESVQRVVKAGLARIVSRGLPCPWGGIATEYRWIGQF